MLDQSELLTAAKDIGAQLALRGDEIEQARRLPVDVAAMLGQAGFYRMGAPSEVGGLETQPAISSQVFETLAQHDASAAWVAFIGTTSYTNLAALPAAVGRKVLTDPATLITGVFAPTGTARKTAEGYRVSGRWQWGSGSQNASWIMGGVMLEQDGEPILDRKGRPKSTMVMMSRDDVEFLDTWHVSGLCGSGSLDYQVQDLLVPEHHVVGLKSADPVQPTTLYRFPAFTFLALGIAAVCLGIARAAINELVSLAQTKKRVGARNTIAEQQIAQMTLAQAEADLKSARLFYYQAIEDAWQQAIANDRVSLELRRELRLATNNAVSKSVKVVEEMYSLGGGSAVYLDSRLQRHWRDINVAKSHIMVSSQVLEITGALYFGLEPNVSRL